MGPINDITGIVSQFNKVEKEANSKRIKPSQTTGDSKTTGVKSSAQSVSVEISTSGKYLLKQEQDLLRYVETLKNQTTISSDQLTSLQQRVNEGYYSRSEVVERIADAIAALPLFQELGEEAAKSVNSPNTTMDTRDVARIRENIRNRVYDEDHVTEKIVERILKTVKPEN